MIPPLQLTESTSRTLRAMFQMDHLQWLCVFVAGLTALIGMQNQNNMSFVNNDGAESPQSISNPVITDVFNPIFDHDEYVFIHNDQTCIKFDQPQLWMDKVNQGGVKKVKEVRDAEFHQKASKLVSERNYDDLLVLLNFRSQGVSSGKISEDEVLQCANKVKARKAEGGKFEFTDEERRIIVLWKKMSGDTNSAIADLFGTTDQTVGKIIRASKESKS